MALLIDYIAYLPISGSSTHGVLCINHEYIGTAYDFFSLFMQRAGLGKCIQRVAGHDEKSVGLSVIEVKNNRLAAQTIADILKDWVNQTIFYMDKAKP
ncbi:MAG: DUF839 domain-containing protein [Cellvibrionales bacterium]|nr:DUF839 domain-containing protein [Cellvibrionales bacterium]